MILSEYFSNNYNSIIGIDEAGRGAIAGPIAFASFFFSENNLKIDGVRDSKLLSEKKRNALFFKITTFYPHNYYDIVFVSEDIIDEYGISYAVKFALSYFSDFVAKHSPDIVVVDGIYNYLLEYKYISLKKADKLLYPVSVASILAKVIRDRYMYMLNDFYPEYGFSHHKGYPTKLHRESLRKYGILPIHRKSYKLL